MNDRRRQRGMHWGHLPSPRARYSWVWCAESLRKYITLRSSFIAFLNKYTASFFAANIYKLIYKHNNTNFHDFLCRPNISQKSTWTQSYSVSKMSLLCLAENLTHVNQFGQFLAQNNVTEKLGIHLYFCTTRWNVGTQKITFIRSNAVLELQLMHIAWLELGLVVIESC